MNKHIQTLIGFKNGTKELAKESFYDLWDAWGELINAFKKIGYVIFVFAMWLLALSLICILPLATWLRLKWERDYEKAVKKAKKDYSNGVIRVKRGEHE